MMAEACAHLRISYRTEPYGQGVTRGWWECDSGCGQPFGPIPTPRDRGSLEDLYEDLYAVGVWKCLSCNFRWFRNVINANTGHVHADAKKVGPCPNDGEPMVRVTWREVAEGQNESLRELTDDFLAVIEALGATSRYDAAEKARQLREEINAKDRERR